MEPESFESTCISYLASIIALPRSTMRMTENDRRRNHDSLPAIGCREARVGSYLTEVSVRINVERTDEVVATGADSLGVACPYCLIMLDDGAKVRGGELRVVDVAQVVAASLEPPPGQTNGDGRAPETR